MEVLKFIFSSFWIWLGTVILVVACSGVLSGIINITIQRKGKD